MKIFLPSLTSTAQIVYHITLHKLTVYSSYAEFIEVGLLVKPYYGLATHLWLP